MNLLPNGHTARTKLDRLQAKIQSIHEAEHALEKQPPSEQERRALITRDIDAALRLSGAELSRGYAVVNPQSKETINALQSLLIRALGPETIADVLMDEYRIKSGGTFGLPAAEKETQLAKLRRERESLEVAEEEMIIDLELQGWAVIRRKAFNPKLVMGIWHRRFA